MLRLIYQGRFLHGNVTLGALRLQHGKEFVFRNFFLIFCLGKTTVMHLVQRENLPEPANGDQKRKHKHDNNQEGTANTITTTTNPNPTTTGCCDACSIS